jgi:hypothetical protein
MAVANGDYRGRAMALAGRSARRGGEGIRWLAIGLVVTLLVLFVDASLHSRSVTEGEGLAAGTWIDRVLPIVATSTEEGQRLDQLWANGLHLSGSTISSELLQLSAGAAAAYQDLVKLRPPINLAGASGLLEACLLARSEAVDALRSVLSQTLETAGGSDSSAGSQAGGGAAIRAIQTAGNDLQVGDQAYTLFSRNMPVAAGISMPPSVWVSDPSPYQAQAAEIFLTSLQNTVVSTPIHQVKIYSVATTPGPESSDGSNQVLPDATAMTVTIVVADVGNQPENDLTVTAAISPSGTGASSVRDFVFLVPGQAHTIVGLGPLDPPKGIPFLLTITVTPTVGSSTPVTSERLGLFMPAPPSPTTTTSLPTSSSSTGG